MLNVVVEISRDKSYPVLIDSESVESLTQRVFNYTKARKVLVVISEKVEKLYGAKLNFKNGIKFVLKDGEKEKNFKNYQKILNVALKNKLERKDAIIAIGGGVVGDIAGFAAATYLRGIDLIQIPTTLLACVDSSVGGKTAINTDFGKNLVGSFYQPKAVFCNLNFLQTLDERQFKTGLAEVLKYAFICKNCFSDSDFFDFLEINSENILKRDAKTLAQIIKACVSLKARVVGQDEKEQGLRKILNFGHTYAHAVEKITNYKKYTHGEAVAFGMVYAMNLALKKGLITQDYAQKANHLLEKYALVQKMPKFDTIKLVELMKSDKKVEDGKIRFILPVQKSLVDNFEVKQDEILNA